MTRALGPVLVTGAAGFLGAALVARLRHMGHAVTASDINVPDAACDLTDFVQVESLVARGPFRTIFHCGAVSGPMVLADQPLAIWRINALGTAHVLEAARLHKVARIIVCSTCDVYGDRSGVVNEATPLSPTSIYGASKVAAEAAMLGYVREHGLDAVALRLAWIYGPGRQTPTTLEEMIRASLAGRGLSVAASAEDITHYLYIDDAVQGLIRAAQVERLAGRVYNISAGQGVPMGDVVKVFARMAPDCAVTLSGGSTSAVPLALVNQRAAQDFGFKPVTTLEHGLRFYRDALMG